jgi:hypothetical protein
MVEERMGPLVIVVCLVLSGAISREISKKLKVDIRTVSLCLGMLLAYVLTHYGLEKKLLSTVIEVVPNVNEWLLSTLLVTFAFGIEYRK